MKLTEHVFFRVYEQQLRIVDDSSEAALYAVMYMAVGPPLIALTVDMGVSFLLAVQPLFEILGKWVYVVGMYAISFWLHWTKFVRDGKADAILRAHSQNFRYSVKDTVYAHFYILIPAAAAIIVAKYLSLH